MKITNQNNYYHTDVQRIASIASQQNVTSLNTSHKPTLLNISLETNLILYTRFGNLINIPQNTEKDDEENDKLSSLDKMELIEEIKEEKEELRKLIFPPVEFEYNKETNQFVVKVEKEGAITKVVQYPTEYMIRMQLYREQLIDLYA